MVMYLGKELGVYPSKTFQLLVSPGRDDGIDIENWADKAVRFWERVPLSSFGKMQIPLEIRTALCLEGKTRLNLLGCGAHFVIEPLR